jgi:sporulation protein YlmC with PRC-barrel domain
LPTTFSLEILRKKVIDIAGDVLGTLADFSIDEVSGDVVDILVAVDSSIDQNMLPWDTVEGLLSIPIEEIDNIGAKVQLKR